MFGKPRTVAAAGPAPDVEDAYDIDDEVPVAEDEDDDEVDEDVSKDKVRILGPRAQVKLTPPSIAYQAVEGQESETKSSTCQSSVHQSYWRQISPQSREITQVERRYPICNQDAQTGVFFGSSTPNAWPFLFMVTSLPLPIRPRISHFYLRHQLPTYARRLFSAAPTQGKPYALLRSHAPHTLV